MEKSSWSSRLGFMLAAAGSAIGLGNIWRFPYIVGHHGGGAFIAVYLLFLLLIGFPVFIAEVLIGRSAQQSPVGAFQKLGNGGLWKGAGIWVVITGFIISSFYSVVAGWILGYLIEAVRGEVSSFMTSSAAVTHFDGLLGHPWWALCYHGLFMFMSGSILYRGVRGGIELANRVMVPLLFVVLFMLLIHSLSQPGAWQGVAFLITPDWAALTPAALVTALGHAFFTLSLGQGTMITYGSYLGKKEHLLKNCLPPLIMDTIVSLLSALVIFTIVFSVGLEPTAGPGLLFHTLPMVFSQTVGGQWLAILFFLLVLLAALTSQISALEPAIAYFVGEKQWQRHCAVVCVCVASFVIGIPSAMASGLLSDVAWKGMNVLDIVSSLASDCLIPVGGLLAVLLVGWRWGTARAIQELFDGMESTFEHRPRLAVIVKCYFWFCFKISAPLLICVVLLDALGVFR